MPRRGREDDDQEAPESKRTAAFDMRSLLSALTAVQKDGAALSELRSLLSRRTTRQGLLESGSKLFSPSLYAAIDAGASDAELRKELQKGFSRLFGTHTDSEPARKDIDRRLEGCSEQETSPTVNADRTKDAEDEAKAKTVHNVTLYYSRQADKASVGKLS